VDKSVRKNGKEGEEDITKDCRREEWSAKVLGALTRGGLVGGEYRGLESKKHQAWRSTVIRRGSKKKNGAAPLKIIGKKERKGGVRTQNGVRSRRESYDVP